MNRKQSSSDGNVKVQEQPVDQVEQKKVFLDNPAAQSPHTDKSHSLTESKEFLKSENQHHQLINQDLIPKKQAASPIISKPETHIPSHPLSPQLSAEKPSDFSPHL